MNEEFTLPDGSEFSMSDNIQSLNKYPFGDTKIEVNLTIIEYLTFAGKNESR